MKRGARSFGKQREREGEREEYTQRGRRKEMRKRKGRRKKRGSVSGRRKTAWRFRIHA